MECGDQAAITPNSKKKQKTENVIEIIFVCFML